MSGPRLVVDWTRCDGHGLCAELVPELVQLDDWGYPVLSGELAVEQLDHVRHAVRACPALALRLQPARERRPVRATSGGR